MIGIIVAMDEEFKALKKYLKVKKTIKIYDLVFYEGTINNKQCVVTTCGIGKVNASRTTQVLIDNFDINYIINVGVAGSINKDVNINDIVIASTLVQHDFDITKFGHEKGYITGVGKYIDTDKKLVNKAIQVLENNNISYKLGVIASGDIFVTDIKMSKKINTKFDALAVEMESASIAQVCHLCNIPFIVFRSISDSANGKNEITFDQFLEESSNTIAKFLNSYI